MSDEPVLRATDLHHAYGPDPALRGASLAISAGEVVAVTGPSGSGKSTLLHCLAGVLTADTGSVELRGRRLDRLPVDARALIRRREIGLVLQYGQLVPELTALENVALPLMLERTGRSGARDAAAAALRRLGAADLAGRRPAQLSGGQAQRVAIARALVAEPSVLLADEPTGSLDTVAGERVLDVLLATASESGTALVLVTHDNRVAAHAHREVAIRDGATSIDVAR